MERSPFLPLPKGMVIGQVEIAAAQLTVEVISTQPFARCPKCGSLSDHVHGQYQRTVHDVPCGAATWFSDSWYASLLAGQPRAHAKSLPNVFQISSGPGHE